MGRTKWKIPSKKTIEKYTSAASIPKTERINGKHYITRTGMVRRWCGNSQRFLRPLSHEKSKKLQRKATSEDLKMYPVAPDIDKREIGKKYISKYGGLCMWDGKKLQATKERKHVSRIKQLYDLSESQYLAMFKIQKNQCKLCNTRLCPFQRNAHIDHCHVTGNVRGILCQRCNVALGVIEGHDANWHERVRNYLL